MNIWIHRDGRQLGPFPLEQFNQLHITPDTPVWYEGLPGWIPAAESDVLRPLLERQAEAGPVDVQTTPTEEVDVETTADNTRSAYSQSAFGSDYGSASGSSSYTGGNSIEQPKCPPACMFWSIFTTLCCCMPLGIVSIFYSAKVRRNYREGNYAAAVKASDTTQWLIIIGLTLGLILSPITLVMNNMLS